MELSEEAIDRLINAEEHTGGRIGISSAQDEARTLRELQAAGLVSPKGNLTRKGAARAREEQDRYFHPQGVQ